MKIKQIIVNETDADKKIEEWIENEKFEIKIHDIKMNYISEGKLLTILMYDYIDYVSDEFLLKMKNVYKSDKEQSCERTVYIIEFKDGQKEFTMSSFYDIAETPYPVADGLIRLEEIHGSRSLLAKNVRNITVVFLGDFINKYDK